MISYGKNSKKGKAQRRKQKMNDLKNNGKDFFENYSGIILGGIVKSIIIGILIFIIEAAVFMGIMSLGTFNNASMKNLFLLLICFAIMIIYNAISIFLGYTLNTKFNYFAGRTTGISLVVYYIALGISTYYANSLTGSSISVGHVLIMLLHIVSILVGIAFLFLGDATMPAGKQISSKNKKNKSSTAWVENMKTGKIDRYDTYKDGNTTYVSKNFGEQYIDVQSHTGTDIKTIRKY